MASDVEKLVTRWRALADKFAAAGGDIAMAEAASMRNDANELEAALRLTQPAASGEVVAWQVHDEYGDIVAEYVSEDRANEIIGSYEWAGSTKQPLYASPQPDADTVRLDFLCEVGVARRVESRMGFRVYEDTAPAYAEHAEWSAMTHRFYETPRAAIDSAIKGEK